MSEEHATADEAARLVMDLAMLTTAAMRAEIRARQSEGVTLAQMPLLFHLQRHPGLSMGEVALRTGLSRPSVTRLIDTLMARGVVARAPAAEDRRVATLRLTPSGVNLLEASRAAVESRLAQRLGECAPEELGLVRDVTRRLRALLVGEEGERPPC